MPPEPTADERGAAAAAMEGEAHRAARAAAADLVTKRRVEAVRAMEGAERRQKREAQEKAARAATQALDQELAKSRSQAMSAAQTAQQARASASAAAVATELKFNQRVDDIRQSERMIASLKDNPVILSPLRTLKSDMAMAVKERGTSLSTVAIAEQARRPPPMAAAAPKSNQRGWWFLLLFILLIGAAGAGWWWANRDASPDSLSTDTVAPAAFLTAEVRAEVNLDDNPLPGQTFAALARAAANNDHTWTIKQIFFSLNNQALTWPALARSLRLSIPDALARNLKPEFMLGAFHAAPDLPAERFLILKTDLYNNVRAGLLSWEPQLAANLGPLISDQNFPSPSDAFKDVLVRNKDARFLPSPSHPETGLFYGFLDNNTVLLTTNESTWISLYDRFLAPAP